MSVGRHHRRHAATRTTGITDAMVVAELKQKKRARHHNGMIKRLQKIQTEFGKDPQHMQDFKVVFREKISIAMDEVVCTLQEVLVNWSIR